MAHDASREMLSCAALLDLLVRLEPDLHPEARRAVGWLERGTPPQRSAPPPAPRPGPSPRGPEPIDDIDDWLGTHSGSPTNWFVLKPAARRAHNQRIGRLLRVPRSHPHSACPGAYVFAGPASRRPDLQFVIVLPPSYEPEDASSPIAVGIVEGGKERHIETSMADLSAAFAVLLGGAGS